MIHRAINDYSALLFIIVVLEAVQDGSERSVRCVCLLLLSCTNFDKFSQMFQLRVHILNNVSISCYPFVYIEKQL